MSYLSFIPLSACLAAFAAASFGQSPFTERNPAYRLQSGDTIEVQYRFTPEYNSTAAVQPGGFVNLPLIGDLNVEGMTVVEAESAITGKAAARLNQPEVTVLLKDYVHPYFIVAGEVGHPGRFEMHGNVTAMEAIAVGGGFKDSSKHSQVLLVRRYNKDLAEVTLLNMKAMIRQKGISEDPILKPGDMLLVPQNNVSKLERYVRWTSAGLLALSFLQ